MEIDNINIDVDAQIDAFFNPVAEALASVVFYAISLGDGLDLKLILVWLVLAAVFFTFYLGFVNVRLFGHAIDLVRGKFDKDDEKSEGQINRFQALTTALSGTVGLGNIAGVAVAVSVGGPGAVFWMIVMGFFSMATKFAEVMLGVKYRHHPDTHNTERISGGPMYYIRDGFTKVKLPFVGKSLATFYAVVIFLAALGGGSMFQTNQAYNQAVNITGGDASFLVDKGWMFGLFMMVLVGVVIIGGIKWIAEVTSRIVPFMGGLYLLGGLIVIGLHYQNIPGALTTIFIEAFNFKAGMGAVLGAFLMGVQRATFSNESGLGSAAIAHAAVKTAKPVSQGLVGMLGPFIDTIIICSITALVIVITGAYEVSDGMEGVSLTSRAFETGVPQFNYLVFAVVFLFAYSTLISWSYYAVKGFTYVFGTNAFTENFYKAVFCVFIVFGAAANLNSVILLTDSIFFLLAVPNIIALYLMAPEIKKDLQDYTKSLKK